MQKGKKKKKEKKIAQLQTGNYKTIKQRGKKDNPILKADILSTILTPQVCKLQD